MPIVTGPALDSVVTEAREWYNTMRQYLISAMTSDGYPYGQHPLTPVEQYTRYTQMQPVDWAAMEARLMTLYHGRPNQRELVQQALTNFITKMQTIGSSLQQGQSPSQAGTVSDIVNSQTQPTLPGGQ